jgi:proteic killer suppression protein
MIRSFRHKGLKLFFLTGSPRGIQPVHAARLRLILNQLDTAARLEDVNFPGSDLHPLKGSLKGHWAVKVNANWRLIFRFDGGHAYEVDYDDYH